jgi:hypothetical protein
MRSFIFVAVKVQKSNQLIKDYYKIVEFSDLFA